MNFEEMKSEEIRSIIEHGKQELKKREDAETKRPAEEERSQQSEAPQEKAVSSSSVIVKFDEGVMSELSEIRSALAQLVPKKEARDDEDDLDTDADKQTKKMQEMAEKPEEKPASKEKPIEDKKEEDRVKCEPEDDKKEDRACESEDDKKEEDRACGSDKKEERSMPSSQPQQPSMDEHRQEINSVIDSLKELFR